MADQQAAKKILSELARREDLKNKTCNDCGNPNPQWASLSFAVFLCLQCAGTHRGFGVHISFVRSITMDSWQEDQIKRMQLGGNGPFREFMRSYTPVVQGGYSDQLSPFDTYHCWAAAQYREKLDAALAGKDWSSCPPPENFTTKDRSASPGRPSSAQGLRKSRASTRSATVNSLRHDSASPSSLRGSPRGTPDLPSDQKAANESYFANLGKINDSRPTDLPPSQGGRYQGFGNTPTPSQHPSYRTSSSAAPSLSELQENPMAALSKGWSLFSAAVVNASKAVSENVIQPGVEKVTDTNFHASVRGYMTEAQKKAAVVGGTANEWSRHQFGVDVAQSVGGVVGSVRDRFSNPARSGYGMVPTHGDVNEASSLYNDPDLDVYDEFTHGRNMSGVSPTGRSIATETTMSSFSAPSSSTTSRAGKAKKTDNWDDDDWKDF